MDNPDPEEVLHSGLDPQKSRLDVSYYRTIESPVSATEMGHDYAIGKLVPSFTKGLDYAIGMLVTLFHKRA